MSYYIPPFTFDFEAKVIALDIGITDVDCGDLYDAIKLAQAEQEGILYPAIASGSGLVDLGPGVAVGLTVELLGDWQLQFAAGNYIARVAGGNLVGGPSGDPIAYTAGVQTLLIQSAASTVVTSSGAVPTPAQNAAAVWASLMTATADRSAQAIMEAIYAVLRGAAHVPSAAGTYEFRDTDGTVLESGTVAADGTRTPDP